MAKTFTTLTVANATAGNAILASDHAAAFTTLNSHTVPPACAAYHNTTQAITSSTWTAVLLNSEFYDTDGMHSTTTNTSRMTIGTDGIYQLTANILFDIGATGIRQVEFYKNGASGFYRGSGTNNMSASFFTPVTATTTVSLVAGDYIEAFVYHTQGANLNIRGDAGGVHFTATWLGKTS